MYFKVPYYFVQDPKPLIQYCDGPWAGLLKYQGSIPNGGKIFFYVGFEVSTAVVMKSIIFWDMTPCSLLSCNRRFGGTYRLHLQGRRNNSARTSK
jgi:hypothetical protein